MRRTFVLIITASLTPRSLLVAGRAPGAVTIDPAARTIYTANGDNTVSIIPAVR